MEDIEQKNMCNVIKDKRDIVQQDQPIKLKFCQEKEVFERRKNILLFKMKFLTKLQRLKSLGQKQALLEKLHHFLLDNIDDLYDEKTCKMSKSDLFKTLYQTFE